MLDGNLMQTMPNCAKIGFTGTRTIAGRSKSKTHEIFGDYIDQYTIGSSQRDGFTLKILRGGRRVRARVGGGRCLDSFLLRSRT